MRIERIRVVNQSMKDAWTLYLSVFSEVNTMAAQRHLMSWDEFLTVMEDNTIIKYFLRDDEDRMFGLSTLTNRLASWPLISPEYFEHKYPDYYARDAIWYCGFVGVEPRNQARDGHGPSLRAGNGFRRLVCAMLEDIHSNNGMTVMDFCTYNVTRKRLPTITLKLLESMYPRTKAGVIDAQEFWAYTFDGTEP